MSILIQTHYGDFHGLAVRWALDEFQVPVTLWEISEYPARASWSAYFDSVQGTRSTFQQDGHPAVDLTGDIRVVWNRRLGRPSLCDTIAEADRAFLQREVNHFLRGARVCIGTEAVWLNPSAAAEQLEGKACQLRLAVSCGLEVPATLMSNDPDAIGAFVEMHEQVIYKPFRVPVWYREGERGLSVTMTTRIAKEDVEKAGDVLKLGPGIFQEQIPKAYELRVTAFGGEFYVAEIHGTGGRVDDWRSDFTKTTVRPGTITSDLRDKLGQFMSRADLRFGCFDLVVTPEGREIFLEVNQMGQFLWVEDAAPQLTLLDAFARHLCDLARVEPVEPKAPVTLARYLSSQAHTEFERNLDSSRAAGNLDVGMRE